MTQQHTGSEQPSAQTTDFSAIRALHTADERSVIHALVASSGVDLKVRTQSRERAIELINRIRASGKPSAGQ